MPRYPASQPFLAHAPAPVAEQRRAKRLGGKILAASYPAAREIVARIMHRALSNNGVSEQSAADAAGVSRSLVHAWADPESPNKPRLDVLVCVAAHGGERGRNLVVQALREVLAVVEGAKPLAG